MEFPYFWLPHRCLVQWKSTGGWITEWLAFMLREERKLPKLKITKCSDASSISYLLLHSKSPQNLVAKIKNKHALCLTGSSHGDLPAGQRSAPLPLASSTPCPPLA